MKKKRAKKESPGYFDDVLIPIEKLMSDELNQRQRLLETAKKMGIPSKPEKENTIPNDMFADIYDKD
jgi:hypothetical protein